METGLTTRNTRDIALDAYVKSEATRAALILMGAAVLHWLPEKVRENLKDEADRFEVEPLRVPEPLVGADEVAWRLVRTEIAAIIRHTLVRHEAAAPANDG